MNCFSASQLEKLQSIVAVLRQRRQEKSLSLEEIAAKTYIQLRLLRALEENQVEKLPEPVFVLGFIRKYAKLVDMDGAALVASLLDTTIDSTTVSESLRAKSLEPAESSTVESSQPSWTASSGSEVSASTSPLEDHGAELQQGFDRSHSTAFPLPDHQPTVNHDSLLTIQPVGSWSPKPFTISTRRRLRRNSSSILLILAIVVGTITAIVALPRLRMVSQKQPSPSPNIVASPSPESQPLPSVSPSPEMPVQVSVKLVGDSWLQVDVDGKQEFVGTLTTGAERQWSAQEQLKMQIGNAGQVLLSVNGSKAKPAGVPGEVRELTITPRDDDSLLDQSSATGAALGDDPASSVFRF